MEMKKGKNMLDEQRSTQVRILLDDLTFNKVSVDRPPVKSDDGHVIEIQRKSTQITDCSFGELLNELQDALMNGFDIELKVNCKAPKEAK